MQSVSGKRIWVTGASSGIGRELAHQLADKGAKLILSSRRADALETVRLTLSGEGHQVLPLDLGQPESLLSEDLLKQAGDVDILINNGGVSQRCLFKETDFSVYRRLMEVNYLGTVAMTQLVLPQMLKRNAGMIVSISSVAGKVGSKFRTGYSGSKYAVVGFMDCLRAELSDSGVGVLTICPGSIKTDIARNSLNPEGVAQGHSEASIENGMAVEKAVGQMIKAIEKQKDEVVVGEGLSGIAPLINRLLPGFYRRLTARIEYK